MVVFITAAACADEPEPIAVTESADAGGIDIRATSRVEGDSVRVQVRLTNMLDTSADITLNGGCPITLVAHEDSEIVWDEREGIECADPDIPIPLAPHEVKVLSHAVPKGIDAELSAPDRELAARVLVAVAEEYFVEAKPR